MIKFPRKTQVADEKRVKVNNKAKKKIKIIKKTKN